MFPTSTSAVVTLLMLLLLSYDADAIVVGCEILLGSNTKAIVAEWCCCFYLGNKFVALQKTLFCMLHPTLSWALLLLHCGHYCCSCWEEIIWTLLEGNPYIAAGRGSRRYLVLKEVVVVGCSKGGCCWLFQ